MVAFKLIYVK